MSLINDALKKAQRQRTEEPSAPAGGSPVAGARIAKRGRALSSNTMVLIGSGALVLIVLSVVITVNLVNQPAKSTPPAIPPPTSPTTKTEKNPPLPPPAAVESKPPAAGIAPARATVPIAATTPPPTTPAPEVAPAPPPPVPAPVIVSIAPPTDERAVAFIETIRVTGIRSFGNESRVLMNDRVYRVNDIVERNIGLKLTAVNADSLVFTDPRGKTYFKKF